MQQRIDQGLLGIAGGLRQADVARQGGWAERDRAQPVERGQRRVALRNDGHAKPVAHHQRDGFARVGLHDLLRHDAAFGQMGGDGVGHPEPLAEADVGIFGSSDSSLRPLAPGGAITVTGSCANCVHWVLPIETGGWLMINPSILPCCKSFRRFQARPYCIRIWMRGWALRNATSVFGITVVKTVGEAPTASTPARSAVLATVS